MTTVSYSLYATNPVWLPEDDYQRIIRITELFNEFGAAINFRSQGIYDVAETTTGEQWVNFLDEQSPSVTPLRRVYKGALVASGVTTIPHGIIGLQFCSRIFGTAAAPDLSEFIPLPQSAPDDVNITVDQTNIYITTATGTYATYTAIVTLEYFRT